MDARRLTLVASLLAAGFALSSLSACDQDDRAPTNGTQDTRGTLEDVPLDARSVTPEAVVINEIVAKDLLDGPDWVELFNRSDEPVDVSGFHVRDERDDHDFRIPDGTMIAGGGYLVIEGEGGSEPLALDFGLGKEDSVRLFSPIGELLDETHWEEGQAPAGRSWGRHPNGEGAFATLSLPTPAAENAAPHRPDPIVREDVVAPLDTGSPDMVSGADEDTEAPTANLVINEVVAASDTDPDWVELYNLGETPAELAGWEIRDDDDSHSYVFPPGVQIAAGSFLVVEAGEEDGSTPIPFGLGKDDQVRLFAPDGTLVDIADWEEGDALKGWSWGRYPNFTGPFRSLTPPTPGALNEDF